MWTIERARRRLILAPLAALCAASLSWPAVAEDRLDRVRETGELSVAVYRDFPPYSFPGDNGQYTGIDVDLAAALAARLGVRLRLNPVTPGEDSNDDLRNYVWKGPILGGGVSDVLLHVGMDPEYIKRNDKAELFNAYAREAVAVIYRRERIPALDTPLALSGHKVAVENDSISDYYLAGSFNGRLRSTAVRKTTVDDAVDAYLKGEVDAVMAPRGQLEGALFRRHQTAERYDFSEFVGLFRSSWDVGMAIKADNAELRRALQGALDALDRDGELDRLYARYGVTRSRPAPAGAVSARAD